MRSLRRASPDRARGAAKGPAAYRCGLATCILRGSMPRPPSDPVAESLSELGLDADLAEALHAQVARALEGGARQGKRGGAKLNRARNLASQPPASTLDPLAMVPLVLAVRDALKRGDHGSRTSRAHQERLDRAADVAVQSLVHAAGPRAAPRRGGMRDARVTHELLDRIVSVSPDAVFTLRASGAVGMWSVAASRLTGRRRWEVHRRGAGAIFRDKQLLDTVLAELDVRGRVAGREAQLVSHGGDDVSVRIYAARLKDAPQPTGQAKGKAGDPERYLILLHDLSEVQHIRQRLIETEKLSAMAKIAGSVAHEFRNPLNSLFLSTDLLEDELEGHGEVQESIAPTLAAIREEIERLNQIITHYLSLSRVAGSEPEVVDLRDVVSAFATESADQLETRGVALRVRIRRRRRPHQRRPQPAAPHPREPGRERGRCAHGRSRCGRRRGEAAQARVRHPGRAAHAPFAQAHGEGQRSRHPRGHPRARVRAVLHVEGRRLGTRSVSRARDRARVGRHDDAVESRRAWYVRVDPLAVRE